MGDDLVKQARAIDPLCATQCCVNSHLYGEMADRIEELEAQMAAVPALVMREAMDWVRGHDADLADKMEAEAKTPDALEAQAALEAYCKEQKEKNDE